MEPTYRSLSYRRKPRRKKWFRLLLIAGIIVLLILAGAWWVLARQKAPRIAAHAAQQTATSSLAWPSFGQSAVGIVGESAVQTHGTQTPVPTASTAKLITALVVLQKKPLSLGENGPTLTMTRDDLELLNKYIALDGSKIGKVMVGEKLSEYQILEAMLLPSANNMADSLAIWAYGSLPAYQEAANAYLAEHGLHGTRVGVDASGLDPSTVSTAHDMVLIGELVMQNPVLAEIVGKKSASGFPLIGTITNTNTLLGESGIVGIKTGNSDEQGGAFVGAAHVTVNGKMETVVTAVLGASTLDEAMRSSVPLINSVAVGE